jgi:hypothetical protein
MRAAHGCHLLGGAAGRGRRAPASVRGPPARRQARPGRASCAWARSTHPCAQLMSSSVRREAVSSEATSARARFGSPSTRSARQLDARQAHEEWLRLPLRTRDRITGGRQGAVEVSPAQYAARETTSSAHIESQSLPDTSAESASASAADNASLSCPVIKSAVDSTRRSAWSSSARASSAACLETRPLSSFAPHASCLSRAYCLPPGRSRGLALPRHPTAARLPAGSETEPVSAHVTPQVISSGHAHPA